MMTNRAAALDNAAPCAGQRGRAAEGISSSILADIYADEFNIAVWQRTLSAALCASVDAIVAAERHLSASMIVSPEDAALGVSESTGEGPGSALVSDIGQLVEMFCDLFELNEVGLRLTTLEKPMCPRFHFDRVPCRLVTTYSGVATEWLPHALVDRDKLGTGSGGQADAASGLYASPHAIQRIHSGDVALLKGDGWSGNEGAGLVHRSPAVPAGKRRLLLTLDFTA